MQLSMKLYTEPKLSPTQPKSCDMSKTWYVWFRFFDASTNQWKQLRFKKGINEIKNYKERLVSANALKQAIKEELEDGWNPILKEQPNNIMLYGLVESLDYILQVKSATLKRKSQYAYRYIIACLKQWLKLQGLLDIQTSAFTPGHCQQYMDWLLMTKQYSGRTFNDHLVVLSTIFNCFIEREWIMKNPFRSVKRKTQTIGRNLAFTDREKRQIEAKLFQDDRRLYFFTQIMFHCFIRRTELVSIQVKHIDFTNNTIIIPGENAKNNQQESVVIPKGLEEILKQMQLYQYPSDYYVFGRRLETGPVKYKNPNWISTRHNEIVKKLGINSQKGLYSWKHTGVCNYYQAIKDPYAIMRQLRHRDLNTTMIYMKSMGLIQNDSFRNAKVA